MNRHKNALEASGLKRPVRPSKQAFSRIVRQFDLDIKQAAELRALVEHFLADAHQHLDRLEKSPPQRDLAKRLRRIERYLRLAREEAERGKSVLDGILPGELSRMIGGMLTYAALEKYTGETRAPIVAEQKMKAVRGKRGGLSIRFLEEHTAFERESIGQKHAAFLFVGLLAELHRPLGRWVERDKRKAGVRPNVFQDLLIGRLAAASMRVLGSRATSTAKGRFVDLCIALLDGMRVPSGNVAKAVGVVLKKRRDGLVEP